MKKATILLAAFTLMAVSAFGASCPATATVQDYIDFGSSGCSIGDKTFSSFTFSGSASGTSTPLIASNVSVVPITNGGASGDEIGLGFNSLWVANSNSFSDTVIQFTVTVIGGGPQLISDASIVQSSGGFTGTGAATVSEGICGPVPCLTEVSAYTVNTQGTTKLSDHVVFTPTGTIRAVKDIGVAGGTNGTATLSYVEDTFSQTSVPEPASIVLLGSVITGLCMLARRRRALN
jgi:hypothetical protein